MLCPLNKSLVINHFDVHGRWIIKVPKFAKERIAVKKVACELNVFWIMDQRPLFPDVRQSQGLSLWRVALKTIDIDQ